MSPGRLGLFTAALTLSLELVAASPGLASTTEGGSDCPIIEECVFDYLRYPEVALDESSPISTSELERRIDQMDHEREPTLTETTSSASLRDLILEGLNIVQLVEGPGQKAPVSRLGEPLSIRGVQGTELFLSDPFVGQVRGLLLTPTTRGPHPAVLAVHGHTDTPEDLVERIGLQELVEGGFVVLLLEQRVAGADFWEDLVSRRLLLDGHSLLGLRIYESLLGLRFLQTRKGVAPNRIGLLGHSGGSIQSNLLVWLDQGFAACVSDHSSTYFNRVEGWLGDETSTELYRLHPRVNALENATVPTLRAPYDYPLGMSKVLSFLREHLGPNKVGPSE